MTTLLLILLALAGLFALWLEGDLGDKDWWTHDY
jgi:hypothetical protein